MNEKHDEHHKHYIVPFRTLYLVWAGLLICTIITVAASYVDFGNGNTLIALVIATIKALLVILFFMGLKYDGQENNVSFFLSFLFFSIFLSLTASDEFFRKEGEPARVVATDGVQTSSASVDVSKFIKSTPELIEKGKQVFAQNCVTCHGAQGKGDGPAAAALTPKPRNFTATEGWKNGRTVSKIFGTITNGLPGTPMPPFSGLSEEDRFSLVHYIRTLASNAPADSQADLAALQKGGGPAKPRITIQVAMEKLTDSNAEPGRSPSYFTPGEMHAVGGGVYQQMCMNCHGTRGEGGIAVQSVGGNPPLRFTTHALTRGLSLPQFQHVVAEGIPGRGMPGFGALTASQWQELYNYVRTLR